MPVTLPGLDDDLDVTSDPPTAWVDFTRPYTGDVLDPLPPACAQPSPGGKMLCLLPDSRGLPHHFGQHLGLDRSGTFRGWHDRRA